jgi:hypothetical protein
MSARVRIESGIAAGTSYWIDRPVLRVGSDPQCEISVPSAELAAHALTLEFRSGTYRAYNRSSSPIAVGSSTIQPGAAGVWSDGEALTLPGDVRLVLAFDGDPRPSPRPESRMDDGFDDDQPTSAGEAPKAVTPEEAQKAKSKSLMQMAIIGLCVVGGGLLLMSSGSTETPAEDRPSFAQIVESSLKKDNNIRTLVQKLQYAQSFIVRGNAEQARIQFSELRDQLSRQVDSLPADDRKDVEAMKDYVEIQLSQLP